MEKINDRAVRLAISNQFREKTKDDEAFDQLCSLVLVLAFLYFGFGVLRWYFSI
jgi:hypothetical protein